MADSRVPWSTMVRGMLRVALMPVVFLLPAGTWAWPEAWVLSAIYAGYAVATTAMLVRTDPALLEERLKAGPQEEQKPWDRAMMGAMGLVGIAMLLVPPFDVVRFGWTEKLPVWVEAIGMVSQVVGFGLVMVVMRHNTFLSRAVKIDEARGHSVITDGPYAVVRHPMYAAVIPMLFGFPLALGSRWGLLPAAAMAGLMVLRTALEDRTLHEELDGYPEYARKTRYRLVPGLW